MRWQTTRPGPAPDARAPDGSEIRLLVQVEGGSLVHCTLPAGGITRPVQHRTVEEVWYCLSGEGQLWRKADDAEQVVELEPGVVVTIPLGARFQFRASAAAPLLLVIATMPPWPGEDEAVPVQGRWEPTL